MDSLSLCMKRIAKFQEKYMPEMSRKYARSGPKILDILLQILKL